MRMNPRGSIEGLPLYMTLIVIVSAASVTLLSGWLTSAEFRTIGDVTVKPDSIILVPTGDGSSTYEKKYFSLSVHVTDTKGNPIKGAVVTLSGMGIYQSRVSGAYGARYDRTTPHATTDNNGDAMLYNLMIENAYGPGEITVEVTYGHGGIKYITIPVGVGER